MYTFRVPKNNAEFHVTTDVPCTAMYCQNGSAMRLIHLKTLEALQIEPSCLVALSANHLSAGFQIQSLFAQHWTVTYKWENEMESDVYSKFYIKPQHLQVMQFPRALCRSHSRSVFLTAVLLKIQVFWDVMRCRLVNTHGRFERS
jgi:uncharacterized protein involved in tolerance to divalent cations